MPQAAGTRCSGWRCEARLAGGSPELVLQRAEAFFLFRGDGDLKIDPMKNCATVVASLTVTVTSQSFEAPTKVPMLVEVVEADDIELGLMVREVTELDVAQLELTLPWSTETKYGSDSAGRAEALVGRAEVAVGKSRDTPV